MKTLLEYAELGTYNSLLKETQELEEALTDVMANTKSQHAITQRRAANSTSKVTEFPVEELNHKMGEALKRLEAAYRGLGITNKLTNPEDKLNNRSRIMSNIHKIRTILKDVEAKLAAENQQVVGTGVAEALNHDLSDDDTKKAREAVIKNNTPFIDDDGVRSKVKKAVKKFIGKEDVKEELDHNLSDEDTKKAREAIVKNTTPFIDDDGVRIRVAKAVKKKLGKKVDEAWDGDEKLTPAKKGMEKSENKEDLEKELAALKKSGPHKKGSAEYTKMKELNFTIRAKSK